MRDTESSPEFATHTARASVGDRDGLRPGVKLKHFGPSGLLVEPADHIVLPVDGPDGSEADRERVAEARQRPARPPAERPAT